MASFSTSQSGRMGALSGVGTLASAWVAVTSGTGPPRQPLRGGGSMSVLTHSLSLSTTMLRTTFCNSRTLPGQG
ncbi:hypothetical protein D3C78_1778440 [compost metagenome]